jgi:deoxyribodipyrimidine photolyase-like uncharacterized protein
MRMMAPAERELRNDLEPLVDAGRLEFIPHEGWLTTHDEFRPGAGEEPPWRMDAFYRYVRRKTGILMCLERPGTACALDGGPSNVLDLGVTETGVSKADGCVGGN